MGLDDIRGAIVDHLRAAGLEAVTAWEGGGRLERDCPVVAVSLRKCGVASGGFANYLGERLGEDSGLWEAVYGRRVTLTLGLDLYASVAVGGQAVEATFEKLVTALTENPMEGMNLEAISCGEIGYDEGERLLKQTAEAECQLYLYAVEAEGDSFLDFKVKGGLTT